MNPPQAKVAPRLSEQLHSGLWGAAPDPLRVLAVVDDVATSTEPILDSVHGHPFALEIAPSMATGAALLMGGGFDGLVLDLDAPERTVSDAIAILRACEPSIPIVVLRPTLNPLEREGLLHAGADDYVWKEASSSELLARAIVYAIQRQRTRRQAAQMTTVLRHSPDAIVVLGESDRVVFANPTAESLLGRGPGELMGEVQSQLRQASGSGPLILQRPDGTSRKADALVVPIRWESVPAHLIQLRDITDRLQVEARLRSVQKMEALGRLSSGVVHEFNNVLTTIYTALSFLEIKVGTPDAREDLLEIARSADRARGLIDQLLAVSRQRAIEPRTLRLADLLIDVDKVLRRTLGSDVELVTLVDDDLWPVWGDPGQLEQVLLNLAINARDAMPTGGKLVVTASNENVPAGSPMGVAEGHYVHLRVADSGIGMDDATREKVFEPFFTTKGSGRGMGLGLPVCLGITRQIGGELWLESAPGQGTTVHALLPMGKSEVQERRRDNTLPAGLRGSETILVVDDDPAVRRSVVRALKFHGYQTLEASYGSDALQVIANHPGTVHLVLTDFVMPEMTGQELAKRVRESHPSIKIVFMTGFDPPFLDGDLSGGVLIQKPFLPADLLRCVRGQLD